jgi:zinc transporter ZupT
MERNIAEPLLLVAIAGAAFTSTLLGGLLAIRLRDKLHLILGFSAGAVIGVAFFDLLPEAIELGAKYPGTAVILRWAAVGFLAYLAVDRLLLFFGGGAARGAASAGILCMHSFLDGIAIGVAFQTSRAIGIVVAVAVLTHDFSDGVNTMNIVLKNHGARSQAFRWLLADALAPVLGIASTLLFTLRENVFGVVLGAFAGFFLYIGASELIPESYHAHPKFLTTVMTLAGAAVLFLAIRLIG